MNARDNTQATTVEAALQAAPGMMTVPQLRQRTGLDEKDVRSALRQLANLGQLEHIPGRGRYDGRYGLIASRPSNGAPQPEVGENTGSSASTSHDSPVEGAAVTAPEAADRAAPAAGDEIPAPKYDPDVVGFNPVKWATAEKLRTDAAEQDCMSLLNVIADIREAVGDPQGRIMLGDLAEHIATAMKLGDAHRQDVLAWEHEMEKALDVSSPGMAIERINLLRGERDETVRQYAVLKERHDSYEQAISEIHRTCMDAGIPVGHVVERVQRLAQLAQSQREEPAEEAVDVMEAAAGYILAASKHKPRRINNPERAREAAMAAIRSGAQRAQVFALIPVGEARRGAEWREAK
ncbi:hypothetical protein GPA19_05175 [Azoarcus indigens]|uniref:Uncharacterized protein n=1 Tax=Azoarcus indigens TaxID=29545 RepID=A0A4V3BM40_9RHOO|nr:hypothetical protein [Azoarcus indigens]NMG64336.1 hypothetical protein [Azoarcus indigens]TDN49212.1 hypothetical protein C7389_11263 [Azoarcus indigens]